MVEDWENTDKWQLSDKSTNGTDSNAAQRSEEKAGILVDEDDAEGNSSRQDDHDSYSIDLRDHFTCNPPPSYMRSKSGVEMDPDRFRRRKKMITRLPEAQSAIDRMRLIATHWDTDKNGQLLGFDCVSLDPTQFKELFRRNFGVLLTAKDLGILVSMYDKRGEGKADSTEFIKDFWQMGREARNLHNRKRMATVRNMRLKHEARMKQRADRMSRLKEVAVGEHTGKDAETAVAKITEIASCYDTMRDNSFRHLEQGGVMGPTMFREQLRRIFCLRLTRAEVAGLVTAFNLHRDGMVDAKEFARRFHELGRKKRAARVAEGHMKNELARQQKRDEEKALLARIREQSKVKIKWDFTQDELERGKAMIAKAASTYIKGRMGGDVLGIAQMKMDPAAFRAQLMQHFRVRLGPGELGAVFRKFDKDKSMLIDGTELMNEFFRLGREERARRLAEINNQKRRIKEREKEFRSRLENRFLEQTVAKVIWPSLPRDPYDEDHSMNDTRTLNRRGGWERGSHRSVSTGEASRCTTGIKGKGDNSCLPSRSGTVELLRARSWWKRSDLNTSNSTADFLTQIEKEEVAIQTMTCGISHQRRDILSSAAEVGCLSSQPERLYPAGMPQQQWLHRESRRRQNNGRDDNDAVVPSLVPLRKHESMLLLSAQSDDLGDQGGAIEKQNPSRPSTALASLAPGTGDQIFGSADISTVPDTGGNNRGLNTNDQNILAVESGG